MNKCSSFARVRTKRDGAVAKLPLTYQVSVPKAIADQYRLRPGDNIDVIPPGQTVPVEAVEARLHLIDQATKQPRSRGWIREELYSRGRAD